MDRTNLLIPPARTEGLLVEQLPGEMVVFDPERRKAHCLKEITARVWEHADGTRTVGQMADLLRQELSSELEDGVIWLAVQELDRARLLSARVTGGSDPVVSRREVIKRVGIMAAGAAVASVMIPEAAAAASCSEPCPNGKTDCTNPLCKNCVAVGTHKNCLK